VQGEVDVLKTARNMLFGRAWAPPMLNRPCASVVFPK
jgi:hypothetical protein